MYVFSPCHRIFDRYTMVCFSRFTLLPTRVCQKKDCFQEPFERTKYTVTQQVTRRLVIDIRMRFSLVQMILESISRVQVIPVQDDGKKIGFSFTFSGILLDDYVSAHIKYPQSDGNQGDFLAFHLLQMEIKLKPFHLSIQRRNENFPLDYVCCQGSLSFLLSLVIENFLINNCTVRAILLIGPAVIQSKVLLMRRFMTTYINNNIKMFNSFTTFLKCIYFSE